MFAVFHIACNGLTMRHAPQAPELGERRSNFSRRPSATGGRAGAARRPCGPTAPRGTKHAVLGTVNRSAAATTERAETVAGSLLAGLAGRYPGRVAPRFVPPGTRGWVGVDALVAVPEAFERLVDATAARYRTDDRPLAVAQVVREAVSVATGAAVSGWARHGRLLDWRAGNVALRPSDRGLVVALRRPHLVVAPGDPLAGSGTGAGTGVTVAHGGLLAALDADLLGPSVPAGDMPPEPPWRAAAVAAVIAAGRRSARTGSRHYWGSAALAATVALAAAARDVGPAADTARDALLARRPDLARTVELLDDTGTAGCARRLTCCLLIKLPDAPQCATCPLTPGAGRRLRPRGPGTAGPAAAPARATG